MRGRDPLLVEAYGTGSVISGPGVTVIVGFGECLLLLRLQRRYNITPSNPVPTIPPAIPPAMELAWTLLDSFVLDS